MLALLTSALARRSFEEVFGFGQVEIESCGNVLVCTSFLMGLSATELTPEELNYRDPYFPLLICVRAVKAKPMSLGAEHGISCVSTEGGGSALPSRRSLNV